MFRLRRFRSNTLGKFFIGYPSTSNFAATRRILTLFSAFGYSDETLSLVFDILCNDPQLVTFGISAQSLGLALEKSLLSRGRFFQGTKKRDKLFDSDKHTIW